MEEWKKKQKQKEAGWLLGALGPLSHTAEFQAQARKS